MAVLSIAGIREAAARISPYVHRTPVLACGALDKMSGGRQVFFKCELFQKTGSFKARGACNAVLLAPSECQDIVTHSSGNHAQVQYIVQYYQGYPYLHDASPTNNVHVSNPSRTTHPETHLETQNTATTHLETQDTATPQHNIRVESFGNLYVDFIKS